MVIGDRIRSWAHVDRVVSVHRSTPLFDGFS